MPTTTNQGWTTPADTDLVKDGASAIRTLGTAIDTTVFNNAGAAIAKTIVDAKGDIIAATAADTVSRLAVGANDTVLTADSSTATGLKWAAPASGGMTLISTTALSGANTTISSIPQTYEWLQFVITGVTLSSNVRFRANPNGVTNKCTMSSAYNAALTNFADEQLYIQIQNAIGSNTNNGFVLNFFNYTQTTPKPFQVLGRYLNDSSASTSVMSGGAFDDTAALTSITFQPSAGTFSAGSIKLYGVK